ncbi:MAG: chlorohydrolase, partial [Calditrichaeota bacterium]
MPTQSILLKNATFTTLHPPRLQLGDVRIAGGKILQIGTDLNAEPREEVVDLHAKLLLPGFVCAHTHLYSSLARGMPPATSPPLNFLEILQKIWWRLDQALDEESIYYSALIGAIEAVQCGTTTLVDHHASPNCIDGSLDILQEALEKVGLRGVLCYEVTDRGGPEKRRAGLAENERFLKKQNSELVRGLVGAHASFTLEDETLAACADLAARWNTGIHIHV